MSKLLLISETPGSVTFAYDDVHVTVTQPDRSANRFGLLLEAADGGTLADRYKTREFAEEIMNAVHELVCEVHDLEFEPIEARTVQ